MLISYFLQWVFLIRLKPMRGSSLCWSLWHVIGAWASNKGHWWKWSSQILPTRAMKAHLLVGIQTSLNTLSSAFDIKMHFLLKSISFNCQNVCFPPPILDQCQSHMIPPSFPSCPTALSWTMIWLVIEEDKLIITYVVQARTNQQLSVIVESQ